MDKNKQVTQYIREADEGVATTPVATPSLISIDDIKKIKEELKKLVDSHIVNLKLSLVRPPTTKRGFFNTIKRWWSNIWHGPYNRAKNPYYYQNLLGSLGDKNESYIPLEHYKLLKKHSNRLEEAVDVGGTVSNIRLVTMIDQWTIELKKALDELIDNCISGKGCSLKSLTPPVEIKERIPASSPTVEEPLPAGKDGSPRSTAEMPDPPASGLPKPATMNKTQLDIENILAKLESMGGQAKELVKQFKDADKGTNLRRIKNRLDQAHKTFVSNPALLNRKNYADSLLDIIIESTDNIEYFKSLEEYKESPKLSFDKDTTFYEKTLTVLEKLRS